MEHRVNETARAGGCRGDTARYLTAALGARLADEGMGVALALLAVHRTGTAAQGAFVLTGWMAPHVLAAPLTGALAERIRRKRLFYPCALTGFAAAVAGLALTLGRAPGAVTLTVAVLGGSCGPVVTGGLSSLVAGLAPPGERRDRAYGLDAATYSAASVAGPALVSAVAAALAPEAATLLLAGSAACAAALAVLLPYPGTAGPGRAVGATPPVGSTAPAPAADGPPASEVAEVSDPPEAPDTGAPVTGRRRGGWRSLRDGLTAGPVALWRVPQLRAITAGTVVAYLGIGGLAPVAVLLAASRGAPGAGGFLEAAFALGALAGSLGVARWRYAPEVQRLAVYGLLCTGVALAAAAWMPVLPLCAALFALAGLGDGPLLTATLRVRSGYAPPHARTQVFTLGAGLKISVAALGAALAGVTAALPPPVLLLAIAALQLVAAPLCAVLWPRRTGPSAHAAAPTGS